MSEGRLRTGRPMRAVAAALVLLAAAPAAAQSWTARAGSYADIGWIGELAGSCWQGSLPGGAGTDRQCYSQQYDRYLRGTIEITMASAPKGGPPYRGDSVFMWDAARGVLVFSYWGSGGGYGVSEGRYEGELLVFSDPPKVDPAAPQTRAVWRRTPTGYSVTLQKQAGDGWSDTLTVDYRRAPRGLFR